jgi:hypothetical protein
LPLGGALYVLSLGIPAASRPTGVSIEPGPARLLTGEITQWLSHLVQQNSPRCKANSDEMIERE